MDPLPERIEGDGLVLRRWAVDDAEDLDHAVTANVEHLRPWMAWIAHEPQTVEQRRALIQGWEQAWRDGGDVLYAIRAADDLEGPVLGSTGLHRRIGAGGLEVGYWVHVAHTRQGIATRASRLQTDAAFRVPGIDRVELRHDVGNVASRGVPARLGYRFVGEAPANRADTAPAECGVDGVWRVTRDEWLSRGTA